MPLEKASEELKHSLIKSCYEAISMANNSQKRTIKESWSLIAFVKAHGGKLQVGEFANKEDGEIFKSCIVSDGTQDTRVFVSFSSNLGELTPREIAAQKDSLQVVQFEESGNYSLCKQGQNSWEDVDLGI